MCSSERGHGFEIWLHNEGAASRIPSAMLDANAYGFVIARTQTKDLDKLFSIEKGNERHTWKWRPLSGDAWSPCHTPSTYCLRCAEYFWKKSKLRSWLELKDECRDKRTERMGKKCCLSFNRWQQSFSLLLAFSSANTKKAIPMCQTTWNVDGDDDDDC